jgi:hypothetical protein
VHELRSDKRLVALPAAEGVVGVFRLVIKAFPENRIEDGGLWIKMEVIGLLLSSAGIALDE